MLQKAKEYGILDARMLFNRVLFLNPHSYSEDNSCFISGRATLENAEAFENLLSEEDIQHIEINIDSSHSTFLPIEINAFSTTEELPVD